MLRRALVVFLAGSCLLASLSCAKSTPAPKVRKGTALFGAGATFPAPLLEVWFLTYEQTANVYLSYEAVGSGEGVKRFIHSSKRQPPVEAAPDKGVGGVKALNEPSVSPPADQPIDFGMSDSAMTDPQLEQVSGEALLVPVTAGAVALVYNLPGRQAELRLSREVAVEILMGKITTWNDPKIVALNQDAPLPDLPITLVARADASGTTFVLTNHLNAISPEWRDRFGASTLVSWPQKDAVRVKGSSEAAQRVAQTPGALGYMGIDFARYYALNMASLENKAGKFVAPSAASAAAAIGSAELPSNLRLFFTDPDGPASYPIVSFSWALLYKNYADAERAKAVRELFKWCLTKGQQSSDPLGYVPLPENVVRAAIAAVESIGPK